MKYCPLCGSKLKENWKVCPECGEKLEKDAPKEEPKTAEPKRAEQAEKRREEKAPASESVARPEKKEKSEPKENKSKGGLKLLIAACAILLVLGGIGLVALSGIFFLTPSANPFNTGAATGKQCGAGYIPDGANCCADHNSNNICDIRDSKEVKPAETVRTPQATSTTAYIPATVTSAVEKAQATSTSTSSTKGASSTSTVPAPAISTTPAQAATSTTTSSLTTTTKKAATTCASQYGVASDTIIYVYTPKCCERLLNPVIKNAESKGYSFDYVNAESMSDRDRNLLKCYISLKDINVPQLICPANGNRKLISERGSLDQVLSFAKECRENA
jgi:cytoskeletal protein RodZ